MGGMSPLDLPKKYSNVVPDNDDSEATNTSYENEHVEEQRTSSVTFDDSTNYCFNNFDDDKKEESMSANSRNNRRLEGARVSMLSRHTPFARSIKYDKSSPIMDKKMAQQLFAADAAEIISNQLTILGLIAALLSSWGVSVYAGEPPPNDGLCFGPSMVSMTYVLLWISLGFFFLCVSSTILIMGDIDGVPQKYLAKHLKNRRVQTIYMIPEISIIGGVLFLTAGYAVDIGERAGCAFFYFGVVAAPCFVGCVGLFFVLLKSARQNLAKSNETGKALFGHTYIANWRDILAVIDDDNNAPEFSSLVENRKQIGPFLGISKKLLHK